MILALQPAFEGLSKIDAVAKVMQDRVGTVLKTDEIIYALYGELTEVELKAERIRMRDVLKRGVQGKRWAKLRDPDQSYTLALGKGRLSNPKKLLKSSSTAPQGAVKRTETEKPKPKESSGSVLSTAAQSKRDRRNQNSDFRPQYLSDSLIDLVENVLQAHRGQPMTTSTIAAVLFEETDSTLLVKIKKQLNGALFRGLKQKRWQRVRGQNGAYVLA
jgi:hypothetical protein